MDNDWNKWLRERAYSLWEEEGRPDGRQQDHWRQAEEEFAARNMNGFSDQHADSNLTTAKSDPKRQKPVEGS